MNPASTRFEVSLRTIIYLILIVVGIWLVIEIRDIVALLFVAFISMSALRPAVDNLEKMKLPRILAILLVYAFAIGVTVLFGTLIVPPLVGESIKLINNLSFYLSHALPSLSVNLDTLINQIAPLSQNVARLTFGVFSNIFTVITLAIFTFYFLLERGNLRNFLVAFVGDEMEARVLKIVMKVEERLGAWIRGELMLATIIGLASYLGLTLLGVNYALPLAIIAGILEVVPIIGPIVSAVPAVVVALTVSPGLALAVVALYTVIQQLENNLIVPLVMRQAIGMPPLASLLALMIGGRLAGVAGIILAVPVLLIAQTLVQEILTTKTKSV